MTYAEAFRRQASSDFRGYEFLAAKQGESGFDECQPLQCLQMATEKIAKATYYAVTGERPPRDPGTSHDAAPLLTQQAVRLMIASDDVGLLLGWTDAAAYGAAVRAFEEFLSEVDRLHPRGDTWLNCEYPWIDAADQWWSPAGYRFGLLERLDQGDGVPFLDFLRKLISSFDQLPWPQPSASP